MRRLPPLPSCALVLATLLASLCLSACGGSESGLGISPGEFDFGRVLWGTRGEARFTVTNRSDRTVAIRPRVNCGCFALATGWRPALAPGESTECVVLYSSGAVPAGPLKGKFLVVETDHPDARELLAPLLGESYRAFELTPSEVMLGRIDGRAGNYEPHLLRLTPLAGHQVRVVRTSAAPPDFFRITERREGDATIFEVRLLESAHRPTGTLLHAQVKISVELTGADGSSSREDSLVTLKGLWALTEPPAKDTSGKKGTKDAG